MGYRAMDLLSYSTRGTQHTFHQRTSCVHRDLAGIALKVSCLPWPCSEILFNKDAKAKPQNNHEAADDVEGAAAAISTWIHSASVAD